MTWSSSKQNGTMDTLPSFPLKSRMRIIRMLAINSCMDEVSADPFHLWREITVPKLTWGLLQSIEVINNLVRNQSVGLRPVVSSPYLWRCIWTWPRPCQHDWLFFGPPQMATFSGFTGQSFGTRCWQKFQKCQLKHICLCFKAWFHEMCFFLPNAQWCNEVIANTVPLFC